MEEWKQLENEHDKAYVWFQKFLSTNDLDIKGFYESLLYVHDKPPLGTIYNWASEFNWRSRKKDYITHKQTEQRNRLMELNYQKKEELFKAKHNLIIQAINKCAEDFNSGKMTGTQFNQWTSGINSLLKDNRLDINEPTEITDTNIDAVVDTEISDLSIFDKIKEIDKELNEISKE